MSFFNPVIQFTHAAIPQNHSQLYTATENGPLVFKFKFGMQRRKKKHSLKTLRLQTSVLSCF